MVRVRVRGDGEGEGDDDIDDEDEDDDDDDDDDADDVDNDDADDTIRTNSHTKLADSETPAACVFLLLLFCQTPRNTVCQANRSPAKDNLQHTAFTKSKRLAHSCVAENRKTHAGQKVSCKSRIPSTRYTSFAHCRLGAGVDQRLNLQQPEGRVHATNAMRAKGHRELFADLP